MISLMNGTDNISDLRICRRCLLLQAGDAENYSLIREHIALLDEADKVTDELYDQRLALCTSCDELVDGTCLKCGCYVEFRAAFKKQHCPDIRRRAW